MNDEEKTTGEGFSSLKGWHKIMPVVLGALAVFLGVCFITEGTGMFGSGISAVMLGLFSYGAYAIPVLLLMHALFYCHDYIKELIKARAIFSVSIVLIVSAIQYAITFFGVDPVFDPTLFYSEATAGGFIGSIIAFGIIKAIGAIGLFILSAAIIIIYVVFFFSKGDSAFSKLVLSILGVFAGMLAVVEKEIKRANAASRERKAEKQRLEAEKRSAELLDDSFFAVDNGMRELTINELGIHESKASEAFGGRVTLQEQVHHKSAVLPVGEAKVQEPSPEPIVESVKETVAVPERKRELNTTYGLDESELKHDIVVEATEVANEEAFESNDGRETESTDGFGIDEKADSVFTKSFDPFDFATSEKLAFKPSSKAQPKQDEYEGISEMARPLSSITEEDVKRAEARKAEEARLRQLEERRAQFEERKRAIVSGAAANVATPVKREINLGEPTASTENSDSRLAAAYTPSERERVVSYREEQKPVAEAKTVVYNEKSNPLPSGTGFTLNETGVSVTYGKPEYISDETERAAAEIASIVARNNPGYMRSANESYTVMKVSNPGFDETSPEVARRMEEAVSTAPETFEFETCAKEEPKEFEFETGDAAPSDTKKGDEITDTVEEAPAESVAPDKDSEPVYTDNDNVAVNDLLCSEAESTPCEKDESAYGKPLAEEESEKCETAYESEPANTDRNYYAAEPDAKEESYAPETVCESTESEEDEYEQLTIGDAPVMKSLDEPEQFKPYTPPVSVIDGEAKVEEVLVMERSMLSPTPTAAEPVEERKSSYEIERDKKYTVIDESMPIYEKTETEPEVPEDTINWTVRAADEVEAESESEGTIIWTENTPKAEEEPVSEDYKQIFDFDIDDTADDTEDGGNDNLEIFGESSGAHEIIFDNNGEDSLDEIICPSDEDDTDEIYDDTEEGEPEDEPSDDEERIPLAEQNPDVVKQREMFPFLSEEPESGKGDLNDATEDAPVEDPLLTPDPLPIRESATADEPEDEDDNPPFEVDIPKQNDTALAGLVAKETKKEEKEAPKKPDYSNYVLPPIDLLQKDVDVEDDDVQNEIQENADKLIDTLASFNVTASIKGYDCGPRITRYEVVPAKGVKVSNVMNLQDDIALNLAAGDIRMEAPIPGKSAIGVEIPNKKSKTVRLRDLLESEEFVCQKSKTAVCIGMDVAGIPVFGDIAKMPHLLIAGATGMGKSVCINSLMISMLYKARPDEVKFIMIDPKQVEFTMYNGIPHLLVPVVSDSKQAAGALMWAVEEMEKRYELIKNALVRNIDAYNAKIAEDPSIGEPLSRIVIVIDEFADLMLQVRDPVENLVMSIAQKARAAGIHLIIGTQRPSVNVITGTIKANVPSRISCKVASNVDSRTVLEQAGAEKLLDKGDMLFSFAGAVKPIRVQGAFVSDSEVEAVMKYLKSFSDGNSYDSTVMEEIERAAQKCSKKGGGNDYDDDDRDSSGSEGYYNDKQFLDAVEVAVNSGKISTSLLQRKLSIGYGKAAKFIDVMCDIGIVGESNGQKPRDVLITPDEWRDKLARVELD